MKKDYKDLVNQILKGIGGKDNIELCNHCMTRLRVNVKDKSIVDMEILNNLDIIGFQEKADQLQFVIGNDIKNVYDEFCLLANLEKKSQINENLDDIKKPKRDHSFKGIFNNVIDTIVGSVIPVLPILIGSGLLKAFVLIGQNLGWLAVDSSTATTLMWVADTTFYFLPIFVGFFAAKKLGSTPVMGAMLGGVLLHPTFLSLVATGNAGTIFGLNIYEASYSSSIIPVIISVWVMSYIEKYASKFSPNYLRTVLVPLVTLLITVPLMLSFLAPIGFMMSSYFAQFILWLNSIAGPLQVAVFSSIAPLVVMTGMHIGTIPFVFESLSTLGADYAIIPAFIIANFALGGALLSVAIKAKNKDLKSLSFSSAFSSLVPGISEPGLYGVALKYRTPIISTIIGGFIGGLYAGIMNVGMFGFAPPSIFALTLFISENSSNFMNMVIGVLIATSVSFAVNMFIFKESQSE